VLNYAKATVEAWVFLKALPTGNALVAGFSQSNAWDKDLYVDASGKINWYVWDGSAHTVTGQTPLALNRWYHLVGTADGANITLYVIGVIVGVGTRIAIMAEISFTGS